MTPRERAEYVYESYRASIIRGQKLDLVALIAHHIEEASSIAKEVPKCEEHPKYTGQRKPRTTCEACWKMYLFK